MPIRKKRKLFIVDGQVDFCAGPAHPISALLPNITFKLPDGSSPKMGALCVPGAQEDTERLVKHILADPREYDDIFLTLDSHQAIHIAHPCFWQDGNGNPPPPFTVISVDDVKKSKWKPKLPSMQRHALEYVEALATGGRYVLCIWPPHCRVGSLGAALMPELSDAILHWEESQFARAVYVPKGNNWKTEHYSGLRADVPDPSDPTTTLNTDLIKSVLDDDTGVVRFVGQALSHCVANTMRDLIETFGAGAAAKIELVRNMTSNVPGFEKQGDDFLTWFTGQGGTVVTI